MPIDREVSGPSGGLQCPDCSLHLAWPKESGPGAWRCPRCDCQLSGAWTLKPESLLALVLATGFLWIPALTLPLLRLENLGADNAASLLDCIVALMQGLYFPAGILLLFTLLIMPLLNLVVVSWLLWAAWYRQPVRSPEWMHLYRQSREWAMTDIFLLGILIAMTKLGDMATVTPGAGIVCLGLAVLLRLIVETLAQPDQLQRLLDRQVGGERHEN